MYSIAVIGISGFGDIHYKDIKKAVESGRASIAAATVINQDDEKEKCAWLKANGAVIYSDWQLMLSEFKNKIDLCFIPTGIAMHAPMSIAAMRAGANVFVEKPVAATVQEVAELNKVSAETGRFVAIGYQNIYQPDAQELKRRLLDGVIGKVRCLKAKAFWPRNNIYYSRNNWAGKLRNNGAWVLDSPFNNALAHFLNLLCFFAGKTFERSADFSSITAELYRANNIESADTASLAIRTSTDSVIRFYVTHASTIQTQPYIEIHGDKGKVIFDLGAESILIKRSNGVQEKIRIVQHSEYRANIMEALEARLNDPSRFICSLQIAGAQTVCANGAHESSPICLIGEQHTQTIVDGDSIRVAVNNIENIIDSAFEEEKNISELGVEWGSPGATFPLDSYTQFNGGRC